MAFLGIKLNHDVGRLISSIEVPGNKESSSEYHITILCFEENWPITEISKALEATYDVVSKFKPFLIKTKEVTCFPKRKDHPCPIIAKIISDDLQDLKAKLGKEFDKRKIEYSKLFKDYKPHVTLSYSDEEVDDFEIDPIEFSVNEIVLWGGDHGDDRIFITFPLKAPEKHALLMHKTDLFYKLSKNDSQHLTPSYERRKTNKIY